MTAMSTKRLGWTIRPWQLGDHPSTRSLSESCFGLVCSYENQTMSGRPARQGGGIMNLYVVVVNFYVKV